MNVSFIRFAWTCCQVELASMCRTVYMMCTLYCLTFLYAANDSLLYRNIGLCQHDQQFSSSNFDYDYPSKTLNSLFILISYYLIKKM